jgi:hypothetical protein
MAYWSTGTAGMDYEERYCVRCVHQDGCTVMLAHNLYNYRDCDDESSILHILIPRSKDTLDNEQCTMFHPRDPAADALIERDRKKAEQYRLWVEQGKPAR